MHRRARLSALCLGVLSLGMLLQGGMCSLSDEYSYVRGPTARYTYPAEEEGTTTPAAAQFLIERPDFVDTRVRGPAAVPPPDPYYYSRWR